MEFTQILADDSVLAELGRRLERCRLDHELTQAALAEQAGVSKRTVERIEAGASAQLSSLVRVLRVLDLLPNLEQLVPAIEPRPLDLLERKGKRRQRASGRRAGESAAKPWSWGDDA